MLWTLIFVYYWSRPIVITTDFNTKESCEIVLAELTETFTAKNYPAKVAKCVYKGK